MYFLHGFMGSIEDFDFLPRHYRGLEYLNADLSKQPWVSVSTYLWEHIPDKNISLFGYSLGGRIALAMFAAQPDRVEKLVLCGAQFCPPLKQKNTLPLPLGERGQEGDLTKQVEYVSRKIIDQERAMFLQNDQEAFLNWWSTLDLFGPQESPTWSSVKERRATKMKKLAPAWANLLQVLSVSEQPDFSSLIKANAEKITFIYGAKDIKYAGIAEDYKALGVKITSVPNAWHALHLDNPEGLLSILKTFS